VDRRLFGSLGAVAACIMNGADMVRVHDVPETRDLVRIVERCADDVA
jgi:dihydropteroate synthase